MQGMFVEDYKCLECINYIMKLLTKFIWSEFLDYYAFECLRANVSFGILLERIYIINYEYLNFEICKRSFNW